MTSSTHMLQYLIVLMSQTKVLREYGFVPLWILHNAMYIP